MKFKSGFAWVKVNHYSYICKIIDKKDNYYTIEIGDTVFHDVPEDELVPIYGDE